MKFTVIKNRKSIVENGLKRLNFFTWDAMWAYHPSIVEFKKKYYLFYTGRNISSNRLGMGINESIGLAVSSDMRKWNKIKNPLISIGTNGSWDNGFIAHCFVFKDGNKFYMLYDGSKKRNWRESIGFAESVNLVDWKKYSGNPIFEPTKNWWEKRHVSRCCIFKENGIYYLYYAGHDGECERIGMAKGKSLLTFERFISKPVLDVGKKGDWDEKSISDPKVILYKDRYLMFYSGIDKDGIERMGVAQSRDLIAWEKYEKNPILDVSKNAWDRVSTARSDVRIFDGKIYIFYSGRRLFYSIGMAKMSIE